MKRRKFRLTIEAERVMIEHQDELERIMDSDQDSLTKMRQVLDQFKVTHSLLRELKRWKRVSLRR